MHVAHRHSLRWSDQRERRTPLVRRCLGAALMTTGVGLGVVSPAHALNPQPEPPGAQVVAGVARTLFPVLPPNPCIRLPNLGFADNPVLPPNPCLWTGRVR